MKLFCIGCGPGDPDLLTVRAADLIKSADMIFAPTAREGKSSIALSVVEKYIGKSCQDSQPCFSNGQEQGIAHGLLEEKR